MSSILYEYTPAELQFLLDTSNSYSDLLRNIGLNPKGGNPNTLKKIIKEYGLDETTLNINRSNLLRQNAINTHIKTKKSLEDILDNKCSYNSSSKLLNRLIKEGIKEYKCEECGIISWNNKKISLQLHHKDGNCKNNKLENLKILCPNCHSQTENYCGKSSKRKEHKKIKQKIKSPPIDRSTLKDKIRKQSFVSIAKEYGVSDNTIRKWCIKYQLPSKKNVIQNYSNEEWLDL